MSRFLEYFFGDGFLTAVGLSLAGVIGKEIGLARDIATAVEAVLVMKVIDIPEVGVF